MVWTNAGTGRLYIGQPHGGAQAASGVAPQGYLLADSRSVYAPTGRSVPAAFRRSDGELVYYHLEKNHSIGGARAIVADRYFASGGCLFFRDSGEMAARCGRGVLSALPDGLLQATDSRLVAHRWQPAEAFGLKTDWFYAVTDEKRAEVIAAGKEAICGAGGVVRVVDLEQQKVRWSHEVQGTALGLAAAQDRLVVSTTSGHLYCFGPEPTEAAASSATEVAAVSSTDYASVVREILDRTGVEEGICVELSAGTGELALELARQSNLSICAIEADAATGRRLWDRKATYKTRPVIVDGRIYAEGGAWDLRTGDEVPFRFERTHGCGHLAASASTLFFRSATLAYRGLEADARLENFGGVRAGCYLNMIPACGRTLVPDAAAKCYCSYQMHAWLALQPKSPRGALP